MTRNCFIIQPFILLLCRKRLGALVAIQINSVLFWIMNDFAANKICSSIVIDFVPLTLSSYYQLWASFWLELLLLPLIFIQLFDACLGDSTQHHLTTFFGDYYYFFFFSLSSVVFKTCDNFYFRSLLLINTRTYVLAADNRLWPKTPIYVPFTIEWNSISLRKKCHFVLKKQIILGANKK